jgi:hypothetical protein
MTYGMIVQLPVSVAFGTDEEFDLRVRLERELAAALAESGTGECAGGEIDTSHLKLHPEAIRDPDPAFKVAKGVLTRAAFIGRAVVAPETRREADPDDRCLTVLWPPDHAGAFRAA